MHAFLQGSPLDEYLHSFGEDSFADARRLQCYNQIVEKKAQCVHGFFYGLNIKVQKDVAVYGYILPKCVSEYLRAL